jgi:hypothetical protein
MFSAPLAYHEEVLHKQQLVYCVRVMLTGCYQGLSFTAWRHDTRAVYKLLFIQRLLKMSK